MRTAALALLLFAAESQAAIVGIVPLRGGAQLLLHDKPGICLRGALLIEYVIPGKEVIPGCWGIRNGVIHAAFLDGDAGEIPVAAVEKPQSL